MARCAPPRPHTLREVAAAYWRGRPLDDGEPVPGCDCHVCTGIMPAPQHAPDTSAVTCPRCRRYRDLAHDGASVWYACERCGTVSAVAWPVATVGTMLAEIPRGVRRRWRPARRERRGLDVDAARRADIVEVARGLGIEVGRRGWAVCPFHRDSSPSLHLVPRKGAAFCNVCAKSWDAIALVMELRGCTFADAVREIAA